MEDVFKYIDYRKLWTMFIENILSAYKRRRMGPVRIPSIMKWPTFVTTQLLHTKWSYNTTNNHCIFTNWDDLQQFCYVIPNFGKLKTDKVIILDISMFNEKTWSHITNTEDKLSITSSTESVLIQKYGCSNLDNVQIQMQNPQTHTKHK